MQGSRHLCGKKGWRVGGFCLVKDAIPLYSKIKATNTRNKDANKITNHKVMIQINFMKMLEWPTQSAFGMWVWNGAAHCSLLPKHSMIPKQAHRSRVTSSLHINGHTLPPPARSPAQKSRDRKLPSEFSALSRQGRNRNCPSSELHALKGEISFVTLHLRRLLY